MKINVNFDVKKATESFKKRFEELKRDNKWKDDAAELTIRKIVGETRLGNFIATGEDLPDLKTSTKKNREKLAQYNDIGTSFGVNKSNLTFSGQLLESLGRVDDDTRVVIEAIEDDRIPYKTKTGKPVKHTPTNSELISHLSKKGYKFLGYDEKLRSQIKKKLKEHIRRFLL